MAKIELPNQNKVNDGAGTDDVAAKAAAEAVPDKVSQEIGVLASEMGAMNKARRDAEEAAKVVAEADAAAELEAQTDLEALLNAGESETPAVDKTRKQQVDDMSNSEVLELVSTAVDTAIGARLEKASKGIDKKFKGTAESMSKIIQLLGQMQAATGLERLRGKYSDFDKFKDDTLAVLKKYPMMDMEDAHLLARTIRQGGSPGAQQTETERPLAFGERGVPEVVETASRRVEQPEKRKEIEAGEPHGVAGFRSIVNKALDKKYGD